MLGNHRWAKSPEKSLPIHKFIILLKYVKMQLVIYLFGFNYLDINFFQEHIPHLAFVECLVQAQLGGGNSESISHSSPGQEELV